VRVLNKVRKKVWIGVCSATISESQSGRLDGGPLFFVTSGLRLSVVAGHHVTVGPVRVERDDGLRVARHLRGIGYAWRCRCGERGAIRRTWREARDEGLAHQLAPPAAPAEAQPDVSPS
jgi:hypothetical protein